MEPGIDDVIDFQRQVSIAFLKSTVGYAVRTPRGQKDPGAIKWDPKLNSRDKSNETIKAIEQTAPIALPDGALTDQGRAVIAAAGSGDLAPGQAAQLLAGLGSLAKLVETDELERRIAALETVLRAIPACPVHGDLCIPHALGWVRSKLDAPGPAPAAAVMARAISCANSV